jgi:hypothetical protein
MTEDCKTPSYWLPRHEFNQYVDLNNRGITVAMVAAKEAVDRAATATEKRFESVNEFRQTLSDQTSSFVSRNEYNAALSASIQRSEALARSIAAIEGRNLGASDLGSKIIAVAAVIIALVSSLLTHWK